MQFDDGETGDRAQRLEDACDIDHAGAVAVVLDDRHDRSAADTLTDGCHVPVQRRGVNLDPRVE